MQQGFALGVTMLVVLASLAASAAAQVDEFDDLPDYRPGIVGEYRGSDEAPHRRVDEAVAFVWGGQAPDPRVPEGPFSVRWSGRLWVQVPGAYRLYVYGAGRVRLRVDGQEVLAAEFAEPQWMEARALELPFGHHPLEIEYRSCPERAQLSLYWEGPDFQREPIAPRWLFHDPDQSPGDEFQRGALLVRGLRCAACHAIPGPRKALPAPALTRLSGNVSHAWLVEWIEHSGRHPSPSAVNGSERAQVAAKAGVPIAMPAFDLTRDEAAAIAAYLLTRSEPPMRGEDDQDPLQKSKQTPQSSEKKKPKPPSAAAGRRLALSKGCLACHQLGDLGKATLFGGGQLSGVAEKRPADFFDRWLRSPAAINPDHRMPRFDLGHEERGHLVAYLRTLKDEMSATDADAPEEHAPSQIERGRKLLVEHRCGACHALPGSLAKPPSLDLPPLAGDLDDPRACLGPPDKVQHRPGYQLAAQVRTVVRTYLEQVESDYRPTDADRARFALAERKCFACHERGLREGVKDILPDVVAAHGELASRLAALSPPALDGVGDKYRADYLAAAVAVESPRLRPWLDVQMPKFDFAPEELEAIAEHFIHRDRIPAYETAPVLDVEPTSQRLAGARLVTSAGFGCTSCHKISSAEPVKVELKERGTDLSLLGKRVRRSWYDRWVRNPSRIVPRMEMPAIKLPVPGVLGADLDVQLASVWHVLNEPGFNPPQPGAVRVVRLRNIPEANERAYVLTDVLETGSGASSVKPFLIALGNRHNVTLDLATNSLAQWRIGDAARQRTRGKTWYWEAGGSTVVPGGGETDLRLLLDGEPQSPFAAGQFVTEFDAYEHVGRGVRMLHRLHFPRPGAKDDVLVLRLAQSFTPIFARSNDAHSGFSRKVEVAGLPPGDTLELRIGGAWLVPAAGGRTAAGQGPLGRVEVRLISPDEGRLITSGDQVVLRLTGSSSDERLTLHLDYLTDAPVDRFPQAAPAPPDLPPTELDLVPGFEATRLGLSSEVMPTGFAFRDDGSLVIASLKGRVWIARDRDGDQLHDRLTLFSDDLAAPYGTQVAGDAVDVINKYALLRLHDEDGDDRADRTEVLASGWGHTRDYHDWAVGLERDAAGSYYVALPCQQDDRSEAAARLRGHALKLVPRKPTPEYPHCFAVTSWCAGLRFPMGLALNRAGDLFATDNQGNYNPFNELNHLRHGRRYGFINRLEARRGLKPPFEYPAIDLPHPWTRSVNGIAFLDTPAALREKLGRDVFGPFEGHLVGCEYNGRRLIRMSLQRVGDTYQGAAYPFTYAPAGSAEQILGPVACAVSPQGDLYVGTVLDSGWGGGSNIGEVIRLRRDGELPPGIAEVRAVADGFTVEFTTPVDAAEAARAENYAVSSYRRIPTPAYGGPDRDRRTERIAGVVVSADARRVRLRLSELREGFVYEFRLADALAPGDAQLYPAQAHYTLRHRVKP